MNSKYLWGLGSGRGMAIGVDMVKQPEPAVREIVTNDTSKRRLLQFAAQIQHANATANPYSAAVRMDHEELCHQCLMLGVPLEGHESTGRLVSLRDHYAAGKHLPEFTPDMRGEEIRLIDDITSKVRRERNQRKRERRARRGKT